MIPLGYLPDHTQGRLVGFNVHFRLAYVWRKMADSGDLAAKRNDSGSSSSVSMESISTLTELEDLESVYQQLCAEEVRSDDR